jgi:hypothetical protein
MRFEQDLVSYADNTGAKQRRAMLFTARQFISSFSSLLPCLQLRDLCNDRNLDRRCEVNAFLHSCYTAPGFERLTRRVSVGGHVDLKYVFALVEVACSYSLLVSSIIARQYFNANAISHNGYVGYSYYS